MDDSSASTTVMATPQLKLARRAAVAVKVEVSELDLIMQLARRRNDVLSGTPPRSEEGRRVVAASRTMERIRDLRV